MKSTKTQEYISSLGLNVKVKQSLNPGADPANIDNNGFYLITNIDSSNVSTKIKNLIKFVYEYLN